MLSGALVLLLISTMAAGAAIGRGPATASAQADTMDTASLAPEDALIYISASLDTESEQWQQADELLGRLGVESVEDALRSAGETTTDAEMGALADLDPFLGGEVALVLTSLEAAQEAGAEISGEAGVPGVTDALPVGSPEATADGGTQGFAAIVEPADMDAAWTTVREAIQEQSDQTGVSVTEETYEGVTIISVAGDEAAGVTGTAAAQVDGFIVFSEAVADVQSIIDVQQGTTGSLADAPRFQEVAATFTDPRLAFVYVNGPAFLAASMTGAEMAELGQMGQFGELLTSSFNVYSGVTISAQEAGFRFDTVSIPGEEGARPPTPANFDPALPDQVPSNTVVFANGADLGASGVLDAIGLLFVQGMIGVDSAATPVPGQSSEEYAAGLFDQAAQLLGFNLQTDFIDQMVGEYAFALWGIESLDPTQVNALLVSGAENPATLNDALSKISLLVQSGGQGQVSVTTRQVGGDVVNVIDLSATGAPVTVEYGVVNGEFVLGVNNGVTEYAGGVTDPLSANPTYQEALAALPAEHNAIFYIDLSQIVPLAEQFMGSMAATTEDASEQCAEYDSQEEAQAAYDADTATNWELDLDFDGAACEDFFGAASPEAATAMPDLSMLTAFAVVGYEQDGRTGASGILLIAE